MDFTSLIPPARATFRLQNIDCAARDKLFEGIPRMEILTECDWNFCRAFEPNMVLQVLEEQRLLEPGNTKLLENRCRLSRFIEAITLIRVAHQGKIVAYGGTNRADSFHVLF